MLPVAVQLISPGGVADYTNQLFMDLETDTTASLSAAYSQGTVITWWTNIGPLNPNVANQAFSPHGSTATFPYRTNNVTQTGQPALDFSLNDNLGSTIGMGGTTWSNQPNTIIAVIRVNSTTAGTVYDCASGGRQICGFVGGGSPTMDYYAGSSANKGVASLPPQFTVYTWVVNGASSYYRTNGVLVATASVGANAMGSFKFGNDNTLVTKFLGQISALRMYAEALNTNNLHTAEQNLSTRYIGLTLPSP